MTDREEQLIWQGPLPERRPLQPHPLAGRTKGVRSTSRQALASMQPVISQRQREVYVAIQMSTRPCCDLEIAKYLGLTINTVTARRNELVDMGKVEEAFRAINPTTKRKCIYWKVKQ